MIMGGTDCIATNNDQGVQLIQNKGSNLSSIYKCGNGDPCGGPTIAALYSIDNTQGQSLSSDNGTLSSSHSMAQCFNDYQCSAVMSMVFGIVGVIGMCCGVGLLVAAAEHYKSHLQLQPLSDEELEFHNFQPIITHVQQDTLDAETL